ncbi:Protein TBH-1 a [Aphelenchoides avenae]|nr:Protein TBH-1 a [Aphelenchus avenae]
MLQILQGLALITLFAILSEGAQVEHPFSITTPLNGTTIKLSWNVNWDGQFIDFNVTLSGQPVGWMLVGFSDHGFIENTDYCLYNGRNEVTDGWLDRRHRLRKDMHQDCQFVSHRRHKNIRFKRKFATCDPRDYAIEVGTTNILLATGNGPEKSLDEPTVSHIFRYTSLLQTVTTIPKLPPKTHLKQLDITANQALIPADVTTYWCAIVRLDEQLQKRKHHIVKYEAVVQKGNEHLVHHMEMYACTKRPTQDISFNGNCNDGRKPKESRGCAKVIAAWAMGANPFVYPEEAGMPIGGEDFVPYLMVEMHYNNVDRLAGIEDNSGFRITYTDRLRKNDAAVMELGLIYSDAHSIPPRQGLFPITGHCVADCTAKLPQEGIKIFATQLHSHLTGRKLWTSHYRQGVKIGEINRDNHYSPHWQHIQTLAKPALVLPGDVLSTTCVYGTKERSGWTWGGYGIEDEMCVNYVHYYPAAEVEVCKSAIDNSTLHSFFAKL